MGDFTNANVFAYSGGSELSDKIGQLNMVAPDGKYRVTDAANTETLIRLIQSIPSSKAVPFKLNRDQIHQIHEDAIY